MGALSFPCKTAPNLLAVLLSTAEDRSLQAPGCGAGCGAGVQVASPQSPSSNSSTDLCGEGALPGCGRPAKGCAVPLLCIFGAAWLPHQAAQARARSSHALMRSTTRFYTVRSCKMGLIGICERN